MNASWRWPADYQSFLSASCSNSHPVWWAMHSTKAKYLHNAACSLTFSLHVFALHKLYWNRSNPCSELLTQTPIAWERSKINMCLLTSCDELSLVKKKRIEVPGEPRWLGMVSTAFACYYCCNFSLKWAQKHDTWLHYMFTNSYFILIAVHGINIRKFIHWHWRIRDASFPLQLFFYSLG